MSSDAYGRLMVHGLEVLGRDHDGAVKDSLVLLRKHYGKTVLDQDRSMLPQSKLANALALRVPVATGMSRELIESACDVWDGMHHRALVTAVEAKTPLIEALNTLAAGRLKKAELEDTIGKKLFLGDDILAAHPKDSTPAELGANIDILRREELASLLAPIEDLAKTEPTPEQLERELEEALAFHDQRAGAQF